MVSLEEAMLCLIGYHTVVPGDGQENIFITDDRVVILII